MGTAPISREGSLQEALEKELHLKQHQINHLLKITQAINSNEKAAGLFEMYRTFLQWEIGLGKMALYVQEDGFWICATSIGLENSNLCADLKDRLPEFTEMTNLENDPHPLLGEFEVVIPVRHKEHPIAYVFVGQFLDEDDILGKLQFITTLTNIIASAIENKRLFKRQLEQERLKREMELAGEMQRMLIPSSLPSKRCYELDCIYKPHYGVGGDYFDFIEFEDDKIVFCVGDISGKGVAAALLMANFQANFHTLIKKRTNLPEFIKALNTSVNLITRGDRFITFFIAEYNTKSRLLRYVNAGHNPPMLVTGNKVIPLEIGCTLLGSFKEMPARINIGKITLEKEAMVVAYTDGLTDIQNPEGVFLKEAALHDFVLRHHGLSAKAFNSNLLEFLENFKGIQTVYPDDFTVLTCKIFGQVG